MPDSPVNLYDYERLAKDRLSHSQYDFIAGGATDEITLRRTRHILDSIMLRPLVMTDVSRIDTATTALGSRISLPVMLAPSGAHGRAHPDAELATVRAAAAAGTLTALSSGSSYTLEEVAQAASGPIWFQQYFYQDRGLTLEMARRAEEAGYSAICLTLDVKANSKRERNIRNGYRSLQSANHRWASSLPRDTAATFEYLEWVASRVPLPLALKGIMTGEEAGQAARSGAKAVIVSNHGARQLDTTFSTIEVLPEVVDAVEGRAEVYMDGGIRRGADVVKAIALGARAVFIGRPLFWGLAVNGRDGLLNVLDILREELEMTMALCGRPTLDSLDRGMLGFASPLLSILSPSAQTSRVPPFD